MAITPIQRAGDTGFAFKGRETFDAPPPLIITGDYPAISDQVFLAAGGSDIAAFSVVGINAGTGYLEMATRGMAAERGWGQIRLTGQPAVGDTITVGTFLYSFIAAPVAAGQVALGADENETAQNLANAINATGGGYFAETPEHPLATAEADRADVIVAARWAGSGINAVAFLGENGGQTDVTRPMSGGRGGVVPIGVVPHPASPEADAFIPVWVSGVFNPDALAWHESFRTEEQKRTAFLTAQPLFSEIIIRKPGQLQIGPTIGGTGLDV